MAAGLEDLVAVRREIMDLIGQQMEALDSPLGLTDTQLIECYERQSRVQELRDKLRAALNPEREERPILGAMPTQPSSAA